MLNKQKGQMYPWVNATWNVIKGECPHNCSYCYCKRWGEQAPLHFDEKELKTDLGSGNVIFVGSSCDMWASTIDDSWIEAVIKKCLENMGNRYLFQSKNPLRFNQFSFKSPMSGIWLSMILGTTIETNRWYYEIMGKSISPVLRANAMASLPYPYRMVSIEPIMDFDLDVLVGWLKDIKPEFVSIGADSKGHNLPEPSPEKVRALISELKQFTEIRSKNNLNRILTPDTE